MTNKQPTDDVILVTQASERSLIVQMLLWNNSEIELSGEFTFTLSFVLPDGISKRYTLSAVSGLPGGTQFIRPDDLDGDPNITIEAELIPFQAVWWSTTWTISGIEVGDSVAVTGVISGGVSKTKSVTVTWIDLSEEEEE